MDLAVSSPTLPSQDDRGGRLAPADRLVAFGIAFSVVTMPLARPHVFGALAPADVGLVVAVGLSLLWLGTRKDRIRFPLAVPVGVLVVAGVVAGLLGAYPGLALIAVVQDLTLFAWFLAIANVCRSPALLDALVRAWVWSSALWAGLLVAAVGLGWSAIAGQAEAGGRPELTFDSPNQAGAYFAISLMLVLAARFPRHRGARFVAAGVLSAALILTSSNAALMGTMGALLLAGVLRVRRGPTGAVGAMVAAVVALFVVVGAAFAFVRFDVTGTATRSEIDIVKQTIGRADRSREGRLSTIERLYNMYLDGNLVGIGAAGTEETLIAQGDPDAKSAHNDHMAALVERGILGAVGLIALLLSLVWIAGSILGPLRRAFARVLPRPSFLVGGLVLSLVASFTHEVLHFRYIWALIGLIVAMHLWARSPAGETARQAGPAEEVAPT